MRSDLARRSKSSVSDIDICKLELLLRQIIFRGNQVDQRLQIDGIEFETPTGGRSSSLVVKAIIRTRNGGKTIPAIIKISPRRLAEKEYTNYHQFVKWHLSHLFRVDVLGYGQTKEFGAIAYSFAFAEEGQSDSVTRYIQQNRYKDLMCIIPKIFELSNRGWYHPSVVEEGNGGLINWYKKRLLDFGQEIEGESAMGISRQEFDAVILQVFGGKFLEFNRTVEIEAERYPSYDQMSRKAPEKFQTCIVHGDFNSNNIIVSENTRGAPDRFVYIDFQDTGRGHVFFDFVAFETSLRWYFADDDKGQAIVREPGFFGKSLS